MTAPSSPLPATSTPAPGPIVAVPNPPCPLCAAADWRPHLAALVDHRSRRVFDLERCGRCGFVVTMPPPDDPARDDNDPHDRDRYVPGRTWRARRRASMLVRHFPRRFRGRVLDICCGDAAFAVEMQRRGWTVAVTTASDAVLAQLRGRGIEARRADEALRDGFAEKFDAITCRHVFQRVPDPLKLAAWAKDQLVGRGGNSGGGIFQATVPNLASWQAQRYGRDWLHLDVPRHRYHFTPQTLEALLDKAGLHVVARSTVELERDVFGVMQSALNGLCTQPNVLLEHLTRWAEAAPPARNRDLQLSFALAPISGVTALAHAIAAGVAGAGAMLTVTCRAREA